jgi:hypothetical protein
MRSTTRNYIRCWFALLLLVTAGCAAGSTTDAPVVSKKPKSILFVGNSLSYQHGVVLKASLAQSGIEVYNEAEPELAQWGEDNPFVDLKEEYGEFVRKYKPDIVLVTTFFTLPLFECTGSLEEQALCREEGIRLSNDILGRELVDTLAQTGAQVVWIHYPHAGPFYLERSTNVTRFGEILGDSMIALAAKDPRLKTISYEKAITNPGENFTRWVEEDGKWLQLRGFDDLHLCQFGSEKAAEYMSPLLDPTWDDRDPSWRDGSWRQDKLFRFQTFKGDLQCNNEALDAPQLNPLELQAPETTR